MAAVLKAPLPWGAFDDCMLFLPPQGKAQSFYEHAMQRQAGFATQQRVKRIEKQDNGVRVHYAVGGATLYEDFDSVVVTVPSWILEVDVELQGFSPQQLPQTITRAYKTAHWETSCKVYAPLDPTFFTDPGNKIPQILVTDTFVHDVYAYQYSVGGYETPCILLSYTWEDDATKLASFSDAALVENAWRSWTASCCVRKTSANPFRPTFKPSTRASCVGSPSRTRSAAPSFTVREPMPMP